jgi:hypothetical protein
VEPLQRFLQDTVKEGVHNSFFKAGTMKNHKKDVLLYGAAKYPVKGHFSESEETSGHDY